MSEEIELWVRDPVECVRELLSHSAFREHAVYVPQRVYTTGDRTIRIYDEMWTGDWWWEIQVSTSAHVVETCVAVQLMYRRLARKNYQEAQRSHPSFSPPTRPSSPTSAAIKARTPSISLSATSQNTSDVSHPSAGHFSLATYPSQVLPAARRRFDQCGHTRSSMHACASSWSRWSPQERRAR